MVVQLNIDYGELSTLLESLFQKEVQQFTKDIADYFPQPKPLMDVCELADYLVVSKDWVYKKVQQKSIPYTRVGSSIRFLKKEIDSWLEKQSCHVLMDDPVAKTLQHLEYGTEDS